MDFETYIADESLSIGTSYADIIDIDTRKMKDGIIVIKNLDGSQTLSYKIFGTAKVSTVALDISDDSWVNIVDTNMDPLDYDHIAERVIPANGVIYDSFTNKWSWVKVQAKSSLGTISGKIWVRGVY